MTAAGPATKTTSDCVAKRDRVSEMKFRPSLIAGTFLALCVAAAPAKALILVPQGNQSASQPAIPAGSAIRTAELDTTYERKYDKIRDLIDNDAELRRKIIKVARDYGISPLHIVGAIVGEHTYNVDIYDNLQTYYVKALSYFGQAVSFRYSGESVDAFVHRPQFKTCEQYTDSYSLWSCRETIWNTEFRGKTVDHERFPNNRFSAVFFQPFYAGQTFGLGQLNPLTALEMTDMVHRISGLPKLSDRDGRRVYKTIMDPDTTLPYIAAIIKTSIDLYRNIAGFDISDNPGLTATLYNTGEPEARARKLAAENRQRKAEGLPVRYPQENYYGWFVNEKIGDFAAYFEPSGQSPIRSASASERP